MKGYRFAVGWIALNDSPNDGDDLDAVSTYISTLLAADIFEKDNKQVAKDILKFRERSVKLERISNQ